MVKPEREKILTLYFVYHELNFVCMGIFMRMWMVDPKLMCRNHLLGEHRECHTLYGCLIIGRSIAGHLSRGQVEPQNLKARHDALADEMSRRGYRHLSPLENFPDAPFGLVDRDASLQELIRRCRNCRG